MRKLILGLFIATFTLSFYSCRETTEENTVIEEVDSGLEEGTEEIDANIEEVGEEIEETGEEIEQEVDEEF